MSPSAKSTAHRARDIGLDVRSPKERCEDAHCPFHGHLSVRGQMFEATVVSTAMQRTAVVERTILRRIPKYERYAKRRRRYLVHDPPCLKIQVGRLVRVAETRPLSKTVTFCIVEDLGDAARRTSGEDIVPPAPAHPKEEAA